MVVKIYLAGSIDWKCVHDLWQNNSLISTCVYPSFVSDLKMYKHLFVSRSFPFNEHLYNFG